jgi:hypothetical protein
MRRENSFTAEDAGTKFYLTQRRNEIHLVFESVFNLFLFAPLRELLFVFLCAIRGKNLFHG